MSTPPTLTQGQQLLNLIGGATSEQVQNLLANGDLTKIMLDADLAKVDRSAFRALFTPPPFSWYDKSPEELLEAVKNLNTIHGWGFEDADFPSVPSSAGLRDGKVRFPCPYLPDKGGVRGLYRSFNEFWEVFQAPTGFTKRRAGALEVPLRALRQVLAYEYVPGIRWVELDLGAYKKLSPEVALARSKFDGTRLADIEILMVMVLFPNWPLTWFENDATAPNLSGLQLIHDELPNRAPCLSREDDGEIRLDTQWSDIGLPGWSSPVVRDC